MAAKNRCLLGAWCALLIPTPLVLAQAGVIPPGDANPVLRLETGGATSLVNTLAFSPDGRTLFAGGWDKTVHVWRLNVGQDTWEEAPAYRVPLGPGADGKINAIALSADGNWLAVAGSGAVRSRAGFRQVGIVVPSLGMSTAMREDQGLIYVFNVHTRAARVLRGHRGPVFGLTFAPPRPGAAKDELPPLVSAARERREQDTGYGGTVRVWDAAAGTHRAWPGPLPDLGPMGRPGLAAWRPPGQADSLQVAVAWEDGTFRTWDSARGKEGVREHKDVRFNVVVAALPDGQRVLAGGLRSPRGYFQLWRAPAAGGLQADGQLPRAGDLHGSTAYLPLAFTPLSSRPGGPLDHAAAAVYVQQGKDRQLRLHLLDLDPEPTRFGALKADVALWPHFASMPTLAAAPGGRHLAVADPEGAGGHGVLVYAIQELLTKGDRAQPRRLSGVGETFRHVSFVRGNKGQGLRLNARAKPAPGTPPRKAAAEGDLVFDFTRPGLTAAAGWQADGPGLEGWQVERTAGKVGDREQTSFQVRAGARSQKTSLEVGQKVTDFALLPPARPGGVALLAVAVQQFGEPALLLYDAGSGRLLRHLTGHDDFIRGLAFSADGKLLASAAEDQTVCLWTLADLDQLLGKHGRLAGVAVKDHAEGTVTVARLDADSPAAGKLAAGDVIEGLVVGGKVRAAGSARAFYNALWDSRPGSTVTLEVRGKGRVTLGVDQAVDERQPLLTLFVTRATGEGDRDWIAWNPQGPFADSGPRAERSLGWHLNTGKPENPTSFAKAGAYRDKYYKEGLLRHLVARAALAPALEDLRKEEEARLPPDPRLLVRIGDEMLDPTQADDAGMIALQPRQLALRVKVDDFPADKIRSVEWESDGAGLKPFGAAEGGEWSADLPAWQSGRHTLRVVVRTAGARRPDYTVGPLTVRYQPPPPAAVTPLPRRQVVKSPEFVVRATVTGEAAGREVVVRVLLNGAEMARPRGPDVSERVGLRRGDNLIEIVAVNRNALPGHEQAETARLALEVVYDPQAPQIALDEVVPLLGGKEEGVPLPVVPGEPVRLTVPTFRVRGTIKAREELTAAALAGKSLAGFAPGVRTLTVNQEVTLGKAGAQTLALTARTRNTEATRALEVEYRPQLPGLAFLPPPDGLAFFDEGKGPPQVALRFQLAPPREPPPFDPQMQAAVLINGQRQAAPPALDRKAGVVTATFTPHARDNEVQVRLSASSTDPVTSEPIGVQYLRVPHGLGFVDPPAESQAPQIDLAARVQSPLPLLARDVRATVMGRPVGTVEVEKREGQTWHVRIRDVSLDGTKGSKTTIRLQAANADGLSRAPAECQVIYRGPPPKRADVAIVAPRDVNVTEPDVTVQFRVSSESRLRHLALVNEVGRAAQALDVSRAPEGPVDLKVALRLVPRGASRALDLAALRADAQGFLRGEAELALIPGLNRLHVTATNEAGETQSAPVVVNFFPPPVRVLLDRLEPLEGGAAVPVRLGADGRLSPGAPQGRLLLHGRVVWGEERDQRLKALERVFVRVNGMQQVDPVKLDPPAAGTPRERPFRVKVFLSQAADNRLQIELPGLPQEDSDRRVYLVDCGRPVPEKRMLHLLLIGIGAKDSGLLRDRVLKAVGATSIRGREFGLPAFDQGLVYGPLVDSTRPVERTDVFRQFLMVRKNMDALAQRELYSHVVMVYYQGSEVLNRDGFFLRTSGKAVDPSLQFYHIPLASLGKLLTDNARGAQILLMDVTREVAPGSPSAEVTGDASLRLFADSPAAVMRYALVGRGEAVDRASLIGALEESLRRANRLGRVAELVAHRFEELRSAYERSLLYSRYIPVGLSELVIGPGQKR